MAGVNDQSSLFQQVTKRNLATFVPKRLTAAESP